MKNEVKNLFTKLIILLSILAISWVASACGLTEKKVEDFSNSVVGWYETVTADGGEVVAPLPSDVEVKPFVSSTDTEDVTPTDTAKPQIIKIEDDYLALFNNCRVQNQLHSLVPTNSLNELAKQRCLAISQPNGFSHEGIMQYNLGENIAMLSYVADSDNELLELWLSSTKHRANILNPRYTKTGFARMGKYAVQLFAY